MTDKLSRDGVTVTLNEVKGAIPSMASFASLRMTAVALAATPA
jgi:hypothetical protein